MFDNIVTFTFRSSHQRCSIKKLFLEILQNSQENTCARDSFCNEVAGLSIVDKGGHTSPPLFSDSPFLNIQDVPTFYRAIRKTKVLNESFDQLLHEFYPQSILILEEYLFQW